MTTKKTNEKSEEIKCNGKSACPSNDKCINNFHYDYYTYHNNYGEIQKEPFFNITDRGQRLLDKAASFLLIAIGGALVFFIINTNAIVRRIENTLDKKPVPVHTASSSNHKTK